MKIAKTGSFWCKKTHTSLGRTGKGKRLNYYSISLFLLPWRQLRVARKHLMMKFDESKKRKIVRYSVGNRTRRGKLFFTLHISDCTEQSQASKQIKPIEIDAIELISFTRYSQLNHSLILTPTVTYRLIVYPSNLNLANTY